MTTPQSTGHPPVFDGPDYIPGRDNDRLLGQLGRVRDLMKDGQFRTLQEISAATGDCSFASVSARLRDLRKARFGAHTVEKKYLGDGLYQYRVVSNAQTERRAAA